VLYFIISGQAPKSSQVSISDMSSSAIAAILTVGLWFIHQSFSSFIEKGLFNLKSASYLSTGGHILAFTGIISFVFDSIKSQKGIETMIISIVLNILLLIIGFGLIAVSHILKKGTTIKQENDLTI
jgi:hypothetical protein